MGEEAYHANLSHFAGFQNFHTGNAVRGDAAMQPDNHFATALARGLHHRLAFVYRMADGLFHIDVGVGFHGVDRWQSVPVIGRGDDGDIGTFLLPQFPIIAILDRKSVV